jgi:hypothetical protein
MSKVAIQGDALGTGTFTLASPNSNSDRTLNLPDAGGTVVLDTATQTLTNKDIVATQLTGTIAAARLPAGSVLQVVNSSTSTQFLSSSSTYADTGLSATITPTSATSKILVFVHQTGIFKQSSDTRVALRLLRNATALLVFEWGAGSTGGNDSLGLAGSGTTHLDSPATTSAVTYKTQLASTANSSNVRVQLDGNGSSTITLMEIAA